MARTSKKKTEEVSQEAVETKKTVDTPEKESKKANSKKEENNENIKEVIGSDGKKIKAVKKTKKSSLGLKKKYNDIEDLKNDLVELNKQGVDIVQSDVVNALDRFEMSDDEIDQFYDWLSSVNIDLIDESEEEE